MRFLLFLLLPLILTVGCAKQLSDTERVKHERSSDGWIFLEVVGVPDPNAKEVAHLSSKTARSISAFAFDGAQRTQKEFNQSDSLYLVITMGTESGKTHALVFQKPKK